MAIKHLYTLMCDDVRVENNGKIIIVGLYLPDIGVSQIPAVLPTLNFFVAVEADRPGSLSFKMKMNHLETGKTLLDGGGQLEIKKPGMGSLMIPIRNVQFLEFGAYAFSVQLEEERDPLCVFQFSVQLIQKLRQPS